MKPQRGGVTGDQQLGAVEAIPLATQRCVGIVFQPCCHCVQRCKRSTHQVGVFRFSSAVSTHNPAVGAVAEGQVGAGTQGLKQGDLLLQRLGPGATAEQQVVKVIGAAELQPGALHQRQGLGIQPFLDEAGNLCIKHLRLNRMVPIKPAQQLTSGFTAPTPVAQPHRAK